MRTFGTACFPVSLGVTSFHDIEAAIKTLPKEELAQFDQWYQAFQEEHWDEQIRGDVRAGKLDFLLDEARQERTAGNLHPFLFLDNQRI